MPFALLIVGLLLVVSAVRNTSDDLLKLVKSDLTGKNNFSYWMISILIIGSIGYIPSMAKLSRSFLVLVIVTLFLSNNGFFDKFNQQAFGKGA